MSTVSPFAQGEEAHKAGQKAIANPYTFHSDNWLGWNSGWVTAQRRAQRAEEREAIDALTGRRSRILQESDDE